MYYDKLSDLGIRLRRRSGQEKTTCPKCSENRRNKKDPCLSVNVTEGTYCCHNCDWKGTVKEYERRETKKNYKRPEPGMLKHIQLSDKIVSYFQGRGISKATLDRFFIHGKEEWMPQTQKQERCIVFPYIRNGEIINAKYRDGYKNFKMVKDAELIFFGMQTLAGRHCTIIVEGEADALAMYEAGFGQEYPSEPDENGEVVEHELGRWAILSVPNGASRGNGQLEYLDNCAEELQAIDEFVIAVDNDEAGQALRDALVRRLGVEKCRFLTYPLGEVIQEKEGRKRAVKDANEILQFLGANRLVECVLQARFVPVSGIYFVEDLYESMLANFKKGIQLAPTTRFGDMDEYFRWKKGDINLWTGYANMGKTFYVLQLMLTKSLYDGWKWAVFSPENFPANDFYDDLIEMLTGKWLDKMNEQEYKEACDFINNHIYYIYPEDDHTIENIHEKFRYLILKKGVDGVLIDPFNQLDKNQKAYERDDQYLSRTLKDIKRFALLNAVSYNIIAHPNKPNYKEDRSLPPADMYDLNGGSMWGNKSDQIISYHRPNFHTDKNDPVVEVYIQKIKRKRTGGKHGFFTLTLNWATKRYSDLFGNVFCDPEKAVKVILNERNDYSQMDIAGNWETSSETPF